MSTFTERAKRSFADECFVLSMLFERATAKKISNTELVKLKQTLGQH
jgi:hypothetical protein